VAKIAVVVALASVSQRFGIFASWTIPMLVTVVAVNVLLFRRLIPRHAEETAARSEAVPAGTISRFVAFEYASMLLAVAASDLLPVLVASLLGPEANAYFYVAWLIVAAFDFALSSIGTSLTAEGAHDPGRLPQLAAGLLRRIAVLAGVAVLILVVAAPLILRLFGGAYAASATPLLRLLAVATMLRVVFLVWSGIARVRRRVGQVLAVQAVHAALVLSLSIPLMHRMGITGIGLGYLIAQAMVAALLAPRLWRYHRSPVPAAATSGPG
jgi:O-antigen/teichoic acid export membrane protein